MVKVQSSLIDLLKLEHTCDWMKQPGISLDITYHVPYEVSETSVTVT